MPLSRKIKIIGLNQFGASVYAHIPISMMVLLSIQIASENRDTIGLDDESRDQREQG